jgi:hypothetical protein
LILGDSVLRENFRGVHNRPAQARLSKLVEEC